MYKDYYMEAFRNFGFVKQNTQDINNIVLIILLYMVYIN